MRGSPLRDQPLFPAFAPVSATPNSDTSARFTAGTLLVLTAIFFTLCASGPAVADLTLVRLFPEEPTDSDTVRILVHGLFLDDCWSVQLTHCGTTPGDTMAIDVYAFDSFEGDRCAPAFVPYGFACEYGLLPVGHYLIPVREHRDTVRYPPLDWMDVEFDVEPSTPSDNVTWGRIRALYR